MPRDSVLEPGDAITVSSWFYWDDHSASEYGNIVSKSKGDNTEPYISYSIIQERSFQKIMFQINVDGTHEYIQSDLISEKEWHHLVGSWDSSGQLLLFVDGEQVNSDNTGSGSIIYYDTPLRIGWAASEVADQQVDGKIDEVRIYDRALSQSEIETLYESGQARVNSSQTDRLTDGLVGMWSFDGSDISGTTAYDRSGNENHGTLTNGPKPTIGKFGQALDFDGVDDYVEVNNAYSAFDNNDFTVSVWANKGTSDKSSAYRIVGGEDSGNSGDNDVWWFLGAREDIAGTAGQIEAQFDDGTTKIQLNDFNQSGEAFVPSEGEWNFYTIKHEEGVGYYLYANGNLLFSSGEDNGSIYESLHSFYIGIEGRNEGPWNGKIDDVRIYNRALSADEVKRLYNMGR